MELKYIPKNTGYIIDRKFTDSSKTEDIRTYTTKGTMCLQEILPVNNQEMEKKIAEYAFDSMKENILDTVKKKYHVSNDEIVNYYFEGNVKKDSHNNIYVKFENAEIPANQTDFSLKFEVELKVKPTNFLKVQYNSLIYGVNSI